MQNRQTSLAPEQTDGATEALRADPEDDGASATPSTGSYAHSSEVRASLKHMRSAVRGWVFTLKLAAFALLTSAGAWLVLAGELWLQVLGTLLVGAMFAHGAELQHETLHGIAFRGRRANIVAGIALGLPMLISHAAYRASHLRHHRHLGTPQNREYFDYGDQYGAEGRRGPARTAVLWLVRFSMVHHYAQVARNLRLTCLGRDFPEETRTVSRRIRRDHLVMAACVGVLLAASVLTGRPLIVTLWLAPLVLVAAPVHAAIELPEHFGCEVMNADPFANTRSIRSNRLMFWFTNGNNFHVEHHLMPNLPIERLGRLHQEVAGRHTYYHRTYAQFVRSLLRSKGDR